MVAAADHAARSTTSTSSIRQIRATIFELHHAGSIGAACARDILAVCEQAAGALGFKPACDIQGPIDTRGATTCRSHLLLCLREALSNVARHARRDGRRGRLPGRRTIDSSSVSPTTASAFVPTPSGNGHGLANMRERASAVGGTFSVQPADPTGTIVTWSAPLH